MDENKQGTGKPVIDKEYLKKLAEKIKEEKARKESLQKKPESGSTPPPPPMASISPTLLDDDDEEEDMAAEKTAIIDLTALSGHNADARLTIIDGKDEGKSIDITRDEIFAGRSLDNDFVISDISVSRKHFKVIREGDHYTVSDMGSGNGIKVNGAKHPSTILYHNDVVTAGARQIRFDILNEEMKAKYSRKTEVAVESGESVSGERKKSSLLSWVALIAIIGGAAAAGYFYMMKPQTVQQQPVEFKLGIEDINKIDDLIEQKDLKGAEKNTKFFLEKVPGNKQLNERLALIEKEAVAQKSFEDGKALFAQSRETAEKLFKQIPEDSIFYDEMKTIVGPETIIRWAADEIKALIAGNKEDEALKKIYAALIENPDNEEIKKLQNELTSKVGEEKAKDIQAKAAEEKKVAAEKKQERAKRKTAVARPAPAPKPAPAPVEKSAGEGSERDLDRAIELYLSKDFDGSIASLDKAAESSDKEVSKKARLIKIEVTKFRRTWGTVQSESGNKKTQSVKRLLTYDKKISGGQLASEIESLGSAEAAPSRDKGSRSAAKSSGMNDDEAKELYMRARSMRNDNPQRARELLQQVIDGTDSSNDYNIKSKKLIKGL